MMPLRVLARVSKTTVYKVATVVDITVQPLWHNALLRCEQRNTDAAAYHLKPTHSENATRCESLLNSLLCDWVQQGQYAKSFTRPSLIFNVIGFITRLYYKVLILKMFMDV